MSTSAEAKSERINIRVSAARRELIEQAAAIRGQSLSEFMLASAAEAAENQLLDQSVFQIDAKAFKLLERQLAAPSKSNKKLQELLNVRTPW
jgi:uncharacterized protein (DUF1778 family)